MNVAQSLLLLIIFSIVLAACAGSPQVGNSTTGKIQPPAETAISGQVLDAYGQPVSRAVVRVQAATLATRTDAQGRFTLTGLPATTPLTLTAFAPGYYIEEARLERGQAAVSFDLQAHPAGDNPDYAWLPSTDCAKCHAADRQAPGAPLPFDQWRQDAHAQAAVNKRFLSMYNGTDIDGRRSAPTGYVTQRDYGRIPLRPDSSQPYYGPGYKLDFPDSAGNCAACHLPAAAANNPYGTDPNTVSGIGLEGVPCDLCHKVWEVKLDPVTRLPYPNMPGVLSLEFRRPFGDHQLFIGPFDDVALGKDTFSPLQNQSQFCAPCHFGVFWDTPVYNSFGEWLASPYADPGTGLYRTCQDCHMSLTGVDHFAHFEAGGLVRDPETIFSHRMSGASDRTLLQNSAELQVTAKHHNDLLEVLVTVTNSGAGHHLPTDAPLRQVFLLVEATDEQGQILPLQQGPTLPDWAGDLAGRSGVYFAKILGERWTGIRPTGAYWRPTRLVEDTRLPALAAHTSAYTFAVPGDGEITIEAQLIFRRAFSELKQQKGWATPDILMERVRLAVKEP